MEQYSLHSAYATLLSSYSNYDRDWVQFVKDHYYHIKRKSTLVELNPYKHNSFEFRVKDFLEDNHIPTEMWWIVLFVNQLGSEADFTNLTSLIIPDVSDIQSLRDSYDVIQSHKKRVIEETITY